MKKIYQITIVLICLSILLVSAFFSDDTFYESDDNTLMVHISKIRDKIEDDPKSPKYLKTVRGLGYKIEKH